MSAGRILVVDDQPQMRRFMRSTLTSAGYEIDDAKTGEEALLKIRNFHPDLVVLDMNMPGMQMHEGATVQRTGTAGQYRAKIKVDMAGDWTAKLSYEGLRGSGQTSFNLNTKS